MTKQFILVIKGGENCPNCNHKTLHKTDIVETDFLGYDIYDCDFCKARYRTKNLSPSLNSQTIQSAKTFDNPQVEKAYIECVKAFNNLSEKTKNEIQEAFSRLNWFGKHSVQWRLI